jgi:hypothetical protein
LGFDDLQGSGPNQKNPMRKRGRSWHDGASSAPESLNEYGKNSAGTGLRLSHLAASRCGENPPPAFIHVIHGLNNPVLSSRRRELGSQSAGGTEETRIEQRRFLESVFHL